MKKIVFLLLIVVSLCGCGESFYDSMKLTTASEHIGDLSAKVDLYWSLHQHGFNRAVIAGAMPSRLYPGREDTPEEIERINKVVLTLQEGQPQFISAFPLIRVDDPDPMATLNRYFIEGKAFGVALDPKPGQDLFSDSMRRLYEACELSRTPILIHMDKTRFPDLVRMAQDYPNNVYLAPQLAGQGTNFPRLTSLLWRLNNIYLGFGFGPEDVLVEKIEAIAADTEAVKEFIMTNLERVCFATETNLTEEPYRNSTFAESQIRFMRRFLEKEKAQLKIKGRDGRWMERELPGLALDKQSLGYIYNLNLSRALSKTRPRMDAFNLDLLLADLPKGATYDVDGKYRLIPAVVMHPSKTVTGLSNTQLRKLLSGSFDEFGKISDEEGSIELVSFGPVAKWLAKKLKVEVAENIRIMNSTEAFTDYMAGHENAIGFCTFDQIDFRMRAITIDGESPTIPYIKYCAAKGAGTYGHYFDTYPLLIPVSMPEGESVESFKPHRMRRICIAGPSHFGPFKPGKDKPIEAAQRTTNDVAPYLRDAGLTVFGFSGPIKENCADGGCSDMQFMPGILATGIDTFAGTGDGLDGVFQKHDIPRLAPGKPIMKDVRGKQMMLAGGNATASDLSTLTDDIKNAKATGAIVAAALWSTPEDFAALAPALLSAGAEAVVNIAEDKVLPWTVSDKGVIEPGLGAPFVPKSEDSRAAILILTFYEDRFIQAEPVMVDSRLGRTRTKAGTKADDALKAIISKATKPGK